MKKQFLAIGAVSVMAMSICITGCKTDKKVDTTDTTTQQMKDTITEEGEEIEAEGIGKNKSKDPMSEEYLKEDVQRWTATGEHIKFYDRELNAMLDSVERLQMIAKPGSDGFFSADPWYNIKDYDPNGTEKLTTVTSINQTDSVAVIEIEDVQFNVKRAKTVTLVLHSDDMHWYIKDWRHAGGGSIMSRCKSGAASLSKLVEQKAAQEAEEMIQAELEKESY